ncbi:hypothetical protein AN191_11910 [Loktanella sp. 5RATIMAR09]|uniref:hypothetical protein n=1 Tax=Loktanella sp. 5RATIMAR09 TaxID=1225655 RepID=UPI0006EB8CDB|nr:hypothetical protein [Loktanella sp. 5RATIMAR09]KQI71683.1 hypothetical protein AN191_11910 [Loktanella sp. 5RATIMAR09]
MATAHFINTRIKAGVWHGDLTGAGQEQPLLQVTHLGQALGEVNYTYDAAHDIWHVAIPIPTAFIADGVQTFVIADQTGTTLDSFTLIAGTPLAEDLRAEISSLRGELEVLKTAFRAHCGEN